MSGVFENVREILARILISYGVRTQQAYAELKNMPVGTIHNWIKRGKLPGDYVVMCALDTGADVRWLINGDDAKVERKVNASHSITGERLLEAMQSSGGKVILKRLMDAYGFTMQKQLGEHLGIPSGTMSAWLRREHFPGEVVIACALDTGVSLYWLATGYGSMYPEESSLADSEDGTTKVIKYFLTNGQLVENGNWRGDSSLFLEDANNQIMVDKGGDIFCLNTSSQTLSNGTWLISIDGIQDIYDVVRLPGNKLKISSESASFECQVSDVTPKGKAEFIIKKIR
ncbi:helix-turn-helix domain-containing protein [Pantoea sp. XY16]|uniref:helix-turn-helix domain-containing protein n=1 Tax=Pantoea sp. XY16 TaxID=2976705 RepID=UPI0021A3EB47|nr:helix-turn-helix domain-containing protein [Pantoea sp. XY16]MCT2419939.1 helix-turn-helix domain-containing protein [Pantoea sp. XY16]